MELKVARALVDVVPESVKIMWMPRGTTDKYEVPNDSLWSRFVYAVFNNNAPPLGVLPHVGGSFLIYGKEI